MNEELEDGTEKEREWLKREFGENNFETLHVKLKERREIKMLRFERQKKIEEHKRYLTEYQHKPRFKNLPDTIDLIRGSMLPDPPLFLVHIAEWIAGKIALSKGGRKYKKR